MALQTIIKRNSRKKITLEAFAAKLVEKIIYAPSAEASERYIAVAVRALRHKKINGYIIQRFTDRVSLYLDGHEPVGAQEKINISLARKRLQELREAVAIPGNAWLV